MKQKTLAEKIEELRIAEKAVKDHPMCLKFTVERHYFIVIFPHNVCGIGGIRIAKANKKTEALKTLYKKLEKFWRLDNPVLYPNE